MNFFRFEAKYLAEVLPTGDKIMNINDEKIIFLLFGRMI